MNSYVSLNSSRDSLVACILGVLNKHLVNKYLNDGRQLWNGAAAKFL